MNPAMLDHWSKAIKCFYLLLWGLIPVLAFSAINPDHPGSLTTFVLLYCFVIVGFGFALICEHLPDIYQSPDNADMVAIGIVITIFGLFVAYHGHDIAIWASLSLRKLAIAAPPATVETVKSTLTSVANASYAYARHAFTGK